MWPTKRLSRRPAYTSRANRCPPPEWADLVQKETDRLFVSMKPVQLSGAFDAPQFAQDFINLYKPGEARGLVIMRRAELVDERGKPILTKAGKPKLAWIEWRPVARAA